MSEAMNPIPKTARDRYIKSPTIIPQTVNQPDFAPFAIALLTTAITPGPGIATTTAKANTNAIEDSKVNYGPLHFNFQTSYFLM